MRITEIFDKDGHLVEVRKESDELSSEDKKMYGYVILFALAVGLFFLWLAWAGGAFSCGSHLVNGTLYTVACK